MRTTILTTLIIALLTGSAWAVDSWETANQVTVTWDAVTESQDGTPVEGNIEYAVFVAKEDKSSPVEVWRGPETQATITMTNQGRYLLGLKSLLIIDGILEAESVMGWSDDPEIVATDTFGVRYYKEPKQPTNLSR